MLTDEHLAELRAYHQRNRTDEEIDLGCWDMADVYKDFRRHLQLVPQLLDLVEAQRKEMFLLCALVIGRAFEVARSNALHLNDTHQLGIEP